MPEQATAIVIRGTDWSETSRICTLFTREFGKMRGLAKGGRRLRSNFEMAFDLLTVSRVVFLRKSGGLDLLIEAQVAERYTQLRTNLLALNCGYYLAELLDAGTQEYDPHPVLFDAACRLLRELPPRDEPGPRPTSPVTAFELVWLDELGYGPRFENCAACGITLPAPHEDAVRVIYSPEVGGIVCPACRQAVRDGYPLGERARGALAELQRAALPWATTPGVVLPPLAPDVRGEVRAVLGYAVSVVLGRRPKLQAELLRA